MVPLQRSVDQFVSPARSLGKQEVGANIHWSTVYTLTFCTAASFLPLTCTLEIAGGILLFVEQALLLGADNSPSTQILRQNLEWL